MFISEKERRSEFFNMSPYQVYEQLDYYKDENNRLLEYLESSLASISDIQITFRDLRDNYDNTGRHLLKKSYYRDICDTLDNVQRILSELQDDLNCDIPNEDDTWDDVM